MLQLPKPMLIASSYVRVQNRGNHSPGYFTDDSYIKEMRHEIKDGKLTDISITAGICEFIALRVTKALIEKYNLPFQVPNVSLIKSKEDYYALKISRITPFKSLHDSLLEGESVATLQIGEGIAWMQAIDIILGDNDGHPKNISYAQKALYRYDYGHAFIQSAQTKVDLENELKKLFSNTAFTRFYHSSFSLTTGQLNEKVCQLANWLREDTEFLQQLLEGTMTELEENIDSNFLKVISLRLQKNVDLEFSKTEVTTWLKQYLLNRAAAIIEVEPTNTQGMSSTPVRLTGKRGTNRPFFTKPKKLRFIDLPDNNATHAIINTP